MTYELTVSDTIEIVSIIVSSILALLSLWIAVKSLKQSQKSIELAELTIEESNRPYVVAYRDFIQVLNTPREYLIIKNFGNTGATIDSVCIDPPYENSDVGFQDLKNLENHFIAPRQSISTVIFANATNNHRKGIAEIRITYHTQQRKYSETFSINEDLKRDIYIAKSNPSKNKTVEEILAKSTEELLRRNL